MQLKLTLSKAEYEGFWHILSNLLKISCVESFDDYCYFEAIEELIFKMFPRLNNGKLSNKNRLSLTNMQTLAMYKLLNRYTVVFKTYEQILGYDLIEKINVQFQYEMGLRNKH